MSWLLKTARWLRHAPGLERRTALWRGLRPWFHRLLNRTYSTGVPVRVGRAHTLRIPAEFTGAVGGWASYEPECADAVAAWATEHPDGLMLDLGCAIGMFATIALQYGPRVRVCAADADLVSLACTRRFAGRDAGRLSFLWGLLDNVSSDSFTWSEALDRTDRLLGALDHPGDLARTRYICLEDPDAATLPHFSLDALGAGRALAPGPLLVKCDVEGAELKVLQGAVGFLDARGPTLLLSVHPPALPRHGHSVAEVAAFLVARHYQWRVLARDHEEHWWCDPCPV